MRYSIFSVECRKILCYTDYKMFVLSEGTDLSRSYNKLWKLMIDKRINKTQLCKAAGITTNAMAKLGRNETVSQETLEKICICLSCTLDDIVEFTAE